MPRNSRDHNRTRGSKFCPCMSVVFSQTPDSYGSSMFQKNENAGLRVSFGNGRLQRDPTIRLSVRKATPNCRVMCLVELVQLVASPARFLCLRHRAVLRSAMPLLSTGFYVRRRRQHRPRHLRRSCEKSQPPTPRTVLKRRMLEGLGNTVQHVLRRHATHTHGPAIVRHEPYCSRFRRWTISALQHGPHATFLDLPQESD